MSTSVIKVGVAYVNVCVSKHLKEELACAIDKQLRVVSNNLSNEESTHNSPPLTVSI